MLRARSDARKHAASAQSSAGEAIASPLPLQKPIEIAHRHLIWNSARSLALMKFARCWPTRISGTPFEAAG